MAKSDLQNRPIRVAGSGAGTRRRSRRFEDCGIHRLKYREINHGDTSED